MPNTPRKETVFFFNFYIRKCSLFTPVKLAEVVVFKKIKRFKFHTLKTAANLLNTESPPPPVDQLIVPEPVIVRRAA